jgi:predicted NBD/HSP70 family sugar kinase
MPAVVVPASRVARWIGNFTERHGPTELTVEAGALAGAAADGSTFVARLPFAMSYDGPPDSEAFATAVTTPATWGVLLVRKGGFAVARLEHERFVESKVGQRHVQGRTKAGGQSQQRFARRRDNQARQAYEAAADHAARILTAGLDKLDQRLLLVTGGDHTAVGEVLDDPRLKQVEVVEPWLPVPDPKRGILEQAVSDAMAVRIDVTNA